MIAYLLGVLFLIAGLLVSIALHELGHMIPAKLFGVKVPRYFIGFGPTLWSTRRGETEYGIKAIPLGGFVSIAGMFLPARPRGTDRTRKDGRLTAVQEARVVASEELGPGEQHRAFHALSAPKKLAVMFGGPVVNLVLSFLLLMVVVVGFGAPTPTTTLSQVAACLPPAGQALTDQQPGEAQTPQDCTPTPAAQAGLEAGDTITCWGGTAVADWPQLQDAIAASGTSATPVVYQRDGQEHTTTVTPVMVPRPAVDADGAAVLDASGQPVLEERSFIGVGSALELQGRPVASVPPMFLEQAKATFGVIVRLPQYLASAASSIVTGQERTDGIMSVVGVGRVAGEIASAEVSPQYTTAARVADLTGVLASLNMALFAFNMIPLLPLDGGHILSALIEGARRTLAKVRGKPDPGPVDTARLLPLTYVGAAAMMAMAAVLIVADIVNPLRLFG